MQLQSRTYCTGQTPNSSYPLDIYALPMQPNAAEMQNEKDQPLDNSYNIHSKMARSISLLSEP